MMRSLLCLTSGLASLFLICGVALGADNWTQFRGPDGAGHSDATGLPVTWSETENIVWKTEVAGKAWSSPVVWGKQVWMTNAPADGKWLRAVCLDREDGKVVHNVTIYDVDEPAFCHDMNSYASCTPVIEEGRVYVHFGSAGTAGLDTATGKVLWKRKDLPCDHFRGPASSPILYGNLLIVSLDGFDYQYVVALNKETGETVWRKDRNIQYESTDGDTKKAYGTPTVIEIEGAPQLVSSSAGSTLAYNPLTGDEIWRVRHGGMNSAQPPIFANGLVYLNTAAGGDRMLAVRPQGLGDITKTNVVWRCKQGVPTRPGALVIGKRIYMVSDDGIVSSVDAMTGEVLWQERISGKYSASPIYADGRIYFFSQEGLTTVIKPADKLELLGESRLGEDEQGFMASPAVAGKSLFLRTKTHVYRIGS